jgi:hypothetical protein
MHQRRLQNVFSLQIRALLLPTMSKSPLESNSQTRSTSPDSESESENDHITPDRVVYMDGVTIVRMTGAQMMRLSKGLEIREF